MFVPTGALARAREFWWDELEQILLQPGVYRPRSNWTSTGRAFIGTWRSLDLHSGSIRAISAWRAWQPAPGPRQRLYAELWGLLHPWTRG